MYQLLLLIQKKFPDIKIYQAREYSENQTNSVFIKEFDIFLDSVAVKLDNPILIRNHTEIIFS